MPHTKLYPISHRLIALALGVLCHSAFIVAVGTMIASLYTGLDVGYGSAVGLPPLLWNLLLVIQFPLLHSFLLSARGRRLLAKPFPGTLGRDLSTTTFALIASIQLAAVFLLWAPSGVLLWQAQGLYRLAFFACYALSWIFLVISMQHAGLGVQTGSLGWTSVLRGHPPRYGAMPIRGVFRHSRQPIYFAFMLTLWTGPDWTLDKLLIASLWSVYCLSGPLLKEKRFLHYYGESFLVYRQHVP
ncbi:MAG: hypothetical protein KDD44_03165, partial [Bdellovibrionales bacterium]|nr:hypothetical protein [Bdellovibrionales bacterium]